MNWCIKNRFIRKQLRLFYVWRQKEVLCHGARRLSISNYRRNRYTCFWHFSHGHSDVIHLYHEAFSPEEMPNDPENSHSSDQHRISWIQAVFFLLATVVDDFPLNSDLSSKQKKVSYLQGAHYSGPNIFKTLFKASVQLAVQHSRHNRFFPPEGKACLCRKYNLLGSWSEYVKWISPGIKNHHKSSHLSQSICFWFVFNKCITYI